MQRKNLSLREVYLVVNQFQLFLHYIRFLIFPECNLRFRLCSLLFLEIFRAYEDVASSLCTASFGHFKLQLLGPRCSLSSDSWQMSLGSWPGRRPFRTLHSGLGPQINFDCCPVPPRVYLAQDLFRSDANNDNNNCRPGTNMFTIFQ